MVTGPGSSTPRSRGSIMVELLAAMTLLAAALIPVAYSIGSEKRLAHSLYQRAVAMEIVDGEIEALAAGEWRAFPPGTHDYSVQAGAATNLPPGRFTLTIQTNLLRLEWRPAARHHGGLVAREVNIK